MNVFDERVSDDELAAAVFTILSVRELEVLKLVAAGKHTKQISAMLFVSDRTIDSHRYRISRKLRLPTQAEQAILGWRIRHWLKALQDTRSKSSIKSVDNVDNSCDNRRHQLKFALNSKDT